MFSGTDFLHDPPVHRHCRLGGNMQGIRGMLRMFVVLCCAAGVAAAEEMPDARLQEARTAFDAANTLWDKGQYADAIAKGEQALALREAVLGGTHPDVARSLDALGFHFLLQGQHTRAEPLLQRALAIQEAAHVQNAPDLARTLIHLARLYLAQAMFDRAEPLFLRALALRETALGKHHPLVAEPLNHLARLHLEQGFPARAEPLLQRALAIREAALGKDHLEVAQTLHDLADSYTAQGSPARAEPLLLRALAIRETALGKDHPRVADSLWLLGDTYQHWGLHDRARPIHERTRALMEAALDKNPPDVANLLVALANFYLSRGLCARAEPLFLRAIALREEAVGKSHPLVADALYRHAVNYVLQGMYGPAEPLFLRTLAIWEASLGERHPYVARTLLKLGSLYQTQGLYAHAEPLLQRGLAIRQATLGENNTATALALGHLGSLYMAQGMYARAEPLLRRALAIWESSSNQSNPYAALAFTHLGKLHLAQGAYARAEPLLQRALAITQAAYGENDPDVADALQDLASLYLAQGLYGQARPLYERALAVREAAFGENHPTSVEALNRLAVLHVAQHRLPQALPLLTRAFTVSEQRLRKEALGFSEARLISFLQVLRTDEERLYALVRAHPENARVRHLALAAALLLKGRSVEETTRISRTVYQSLGVQERDTFERLRGLRTQLARLSLQGPGTLSLAAHQQQLHQLAAQGDALEAQLAQHSAPLRALTALPSPATIVDRVAKALPKDGALVEFTTYVERPLVPGPGAPEPQLRYLALVLLPDSTTRALDLGPAEPLNVAAARLRDALANKDAAYLDMAQALYQLAFQPLLPLLGETRRLFLSPDGQLALVPFAALHDGRQFLVETFDFTYLTSGKDLLPPPAETVPTGSVVVLADPDFSTPISPALAKASGSAERSASVERFFSSLREGDTPRAWGTVPLPGTRQEAEAIQRLFPQAQLFLGSEATKERLLQLPPPAVLHVATHGFFLEDAPPPSGSRALGHIPALGKDTRASLPPDPLLRSGLVLAGASAPAPSGSNPAPLSIERSLVTALELAGVNLWGTQLVVLSACDTGRGDIKLGQGVYGLRRAFLVAGAETVVMSLWKVNDDTTRQLMEAYYRHLLAEQGRTTALREAMRELRRTQPHPHYWAPFLAMGRETPLRLPAAPMGPETRGPGYNGASPGGKNEKGNLSTHHARRAGHNELQE
jgi:CHAT domain-containing protein/Tfp pilus assembly protein PilF